LSGHGRQLAHGSTSATTDVEDDVMRMYRNVRQAPVGYLGMTRIHVPQGESSKPSSRLLTLIYAWACAGHNWSPLESVRGIGRLVTGVSRFMALDGFQRVSDRGT